MMNGEPVPTDSICKNIIIAKENDLTPIISCGLFETKLTQYNTVQIPIIIYNPKENKSNVTLIENEVIKDEWEDIENRVVTNWSYTPTQEGSVVLTIQSG
jgi:predicted metal-dependent TIM-barrel fold hydrolase